MPVVKTKLPNFEKNPDMARSIYTALISLLIVLSNPTSGQQIVLDTTRGPEAVRYLSVDSNIYFFPYGTPLFSFIADGEKFFSNSGKYYDKKETSSLRFNEKVAVRISPLSSGKNWPAEIAFTNISSDSIVFENVVPLGEESSHIYITGTGPWSLARTKIFRPGKVPVSVILPDNAWEMGYGSVELGDSISLCAIARRKEVVNGKKHRYKTYLYPGGEVKYYLYAGEYKGDWQNGLKLMFAEKYLYDLDTFDNTLFQRKDLKWIRHQYIIYLQFAWDERFYDWKKKEYTHTSFIEWGKEKFGGIDVFGLWPTWPRLGLDNRNQWDLFAGLPGGLERIRALSEQDRKEGTRFFICYNPWDQSTRTENPYSAMASLINEINADGVVLDCRGASSSELQAAADSVKPGVVMYSEGMAVIRDMPGIVAGRVHDAIVMPPVLNLNKLIKPDFAIFRVIRSNKPRFHRDILLSFFNGYGIEINMFTPGRPGSNDRDFFTLGRAAMIQRENTHNFLSPGWTPLRETLHDSIWVNEWPLEEKTLYTVFNLKPEGFHGPLFKAEDLPGYHYVSLWNHEELPVTEEGGHIIIPSRTDAFGREDLGTNAEGSVDCIARFPKILDLELEDGSLNIEATEGTSLVVWAGNPSYQNERKLKVNSISSKIDLLTELGITEGKVVVQLFEKDILKDERVVTLPSGMPELISETVFTEKAKKTPEGMAMVRGGDYMFYSFNDDTFIPYPHSGDTLSVEVGSFYMDIYPVTNRQFAVFLDETGYLPEDTSAFLAHWRGGSYPDTLAEHPVVYVNIEDAKAYAAWAGKRLPTEIEWQYSAQSSTGNDWPWGNEFDSLKCNSSLGHTTSVTAYPEGESPFGIRDLTGNVWQMTGDIYYNGSYYFQVLKGGSFYEPASSWWYVDGGPRPVHWKQMLLLTGPGMNRNATVGFRCVKDAH